MTNSCDVSEPPLREAELKELEELFSSRPEIVREIQEPELKQPSTSRPPPLWEPYKGKPQEKAYLSEADELFYGGAAGGGKTCLAVGLALTKHHRSLLLRREATDTKEIVDQLKQFSRGTNARWKGIGPFGGVMQLGTERVIEVSGCQNEDDKNGFQGRPHDLIIFDEAPHFSPTQVEFICRWNRHESPHQRCRIVLTGNPPTTPEGRWIIKAFAPWLDEEYEGEKAEPGKLRWYRVDGKDNSLRWTNAPEKYWHEGLQKEVTTPSRTFIPALLRDNPVLLATNYGDNLANAPEPLRSQLLYGDFNAGLEDDAWQVIPSDWVRQAMRRWKPDCPGPMTSVGVDVARGGKAKTVIAAKHGNWFAKLIKLPGPLTPDGPSAAKNVIKARKNEAIVLIDADGIGASAYDCLKECNWFRTIPVNNGNAVDMKDHTGQFAFRNVRAASYWRLREALDPNQPNPIALPPDNDLLADLTAPHYEVQTSGIKVEPKEDIMERLGRSVDSGDAAVLANWLDGMQKAGTIHVVSGMPRLAAKGQLRIWITSLEKLPLVQIDHKCILIAVQSPDKMITSGEEVVCHEPEGRTNSGRILQVNGAVQQAATVMPEHGLDHLLDSLHLTFADLDPADFQGDPDSTPQGIMQLEHGKKLWAFLLKRRDPMPEAWIVAGEGRIPLSLANAACDILHIDREKVIYNPEEFAESNRHVAAVVKASRRSVL